VGHRGELIVDAVAGLADGRSGRRVDGRTLFPVFSVTKAVTALAVHLQAKQVAQLPPLYPPGTANAYHVLVWGWILGEVVRRTDPARPFDVFVADEICTPLGMPPDSFHLGVPAEHLARVAVLSGGKFAIVDEHGISPKAVFPGSDVHNLAVVQKAVDPGAGVITTAGAVARIFALLAEGGELDGVRLLSREPRGQLHQAQAGRA
jgi:CubicO group peptidase (beta-lactamase class C family)